MSFLLDTNVVSEAMRREPNAAVLQWLAAQSNDSLFLSAISLGELRHGALLLASPRKRKLLLDWITTEIKLGFGKRILSIDSAVMETWADLQTASRRAGRRLPAMDSLIAATALRHQLTLVTRNTADFKGAGVALLNPWQSP